MQCPKCNADLPPNMEVDFIQPIFMSLSVKFFQNSMVKIDEPYLNISKRLPDLDLKKKENFKLVCPFCNSSILVSDLLFVNKCICTEKVNDENYCSVYERSFCSSCYKTIMPKICSNCLSRVKCQLYLKREE